MIEKASISDLEDVYALICELEQDQINKPRFQQLYQQSLTDHNIYLYIYKLENKVVGFISFYIHHYLHHHQDTGEIVELVVLPQYRNIKIGDNLISHVEELAKGLHLEEIEISTSTYRTRAHHFYEQHGYIKNRYNFTKRL